MTGLAVTGRNDLTYNVSAGVAVTSIGVADGNTISYWEGGVTPKVDAGDPTNPRIDAVWVRAHNLIEHNDADNFVVVGVTQGTASANPVAPTIPAGALLLGTRRMPANATNTSSATAVENGVYAVPHGASLGMLGEYWWQADLVGADTLKKDYYEMPVTITVPTKRLVRLRMVASLSAYNTNWGDQSKRTEWAFCFQLDGRDIDHSGANFIAQALGRRRSMNLSPSARRAPILSVSVHGAKTARGRGSTIRTIRVLRAVLETCGWDAVSRFMTLVSRWLARRRL